MPDYVCPHCLDVGPNGAPEPRLYFVCTHCGAIATRAEEAPAHRRVSRLIPRGK